MDIATVMALGLKPKDITDIRVTQYNLKQMFKQKVIR